MVRKKPDALLSNLNKQLAQIYKNNCCCYELSKKKKKRFLCETAFFGITKLFFFWFIMICFLDKNDINKV